jgi:hypothetical protein
MNGILIPLFQPFVIGSDRSESDCLGRKSALPHSPAIAQFPLSLVKSFLLLYKNYYFLFLWSEALLQLFNQFHSNVTALFLVPGPGSISNQRIILQSFMSASYKFLS